MREISNGMDSRELTEWQAYYTIQNEQMEKQMKKGEKELPVTKSAVTAVVENAAEVSRARKRR